MHINANRTQFDVPTNELKDIIENRFTTTNLKEKLINQYNNEMNISINNCAACGVRIIENNNFNSSKNIFNINNKEIINKCKLHSKEYYAAIGNIKMVNYYEKYNLFKNTIYKEIFNIIEINGEILCLDKDNSEVPNHNRVIKRCNNIKKK